MARMWQERANYGHFFYRIPNGESAADAYDRVSGFNESLWRSFGEENFASVCVLVTHGLMTRVFLMKWYHFSVEYFEDLRNVNHCEFVVMKLNQDSGKFILQNQLRTWSQLKREREEAAAPPESPIPVRKRWGDSQDSCNADGFERRQLARRQNTADLFMDEVQLAQIESVAGRRLSRAAETEKAMDKKQVLSEIVESTGQEGNNQPPSNGAAAIQSPPSTPRKRILSPRIAATLHQSYDGGGLWSGSDSVANSSEDENSEIKERIRSLPVRSSMAMALHGELDTHGGVKERVRADALGDQSDVDDDDVEEEAKGERSLRSC